MGDKGPKDKEKMRKQHVKDKARKAAEKKEKQTKDAVWPKAL